MTEEYPRCKMCAGNGYGFWEGRYNICLMTNDFEIRCDGMEADMKVCPHFKK